MRYGHLSGVRTILKRWRTRQCDDEHVDPDLCHRTFPDALMNVMLRFETEMGPRTIIASRVPLRVASEIRDAMIGSGQYAELVDAFQSMPMADRMTRLKRRIERNVSVVPFAPNTASLASGS